MKRITAYAGLAVLTIALAACTGNPNGANLVPQSQARHATDIGGGGPVNLQSVGSTDDVGSGGPSN
jgi:hypothetical protein